VEFAIALMPEAFAVFKANLWAYAATPKTDVPGPIELRIAKPFERSASDLGRLITRTGYSADNRSLNGCAAEQSHT
jgi:hypothetical protein